MAQPSSIPTTKRERQRDRQKERPVGLLAKVNSQRTKSDQHLCMGRGGQLWEEDFGRALLPSAGHVRHCGAQRGFQKNGAGACLSRGSSGTS